jgi:5-enolpyruvylshikimate-3-phosphate synthase
MLSLDWEVCVFYNVELYNKLNNDLSTHRIKMAFSIFELMLNKTLKIARDISKNMYFPTIDFI